MRHSASRRLASGLAALVGLLVAPASACDRGAFHLALDIGHTDQAPGAISARGVPELVFNRKLAEVVVARLRRDGFAVTTIEGHGIGYAELLDRAARASALHPDLFLSLHHDSMQRRYLKPWTTEDGASHLHGEHASGFSLFISRRNSDPARSLRFAKLLGGALLARGLHATPHHAEPLPGESRPWADEADGVYSFDGLVVLKQVRAPAALLESGVIVNKDEEPILATSERRDQVAAAISEALVRFCDAPRGVSSPQARRSGGPVVDEASSPRTAGPAPKPPRGDFHGGESAR